MLKIKGHGKLRGDMVFWKFFERVEDENGRIALKVVFFREGYSDHVGIHMHAYELGYIITKGKIEKGLSECEVYYIVENNDNVFIFSDDDGGIIVAKDTLHDNE